MTAPTIEIDGRRLNGIKHFSTHCDEKPHVRVYAQAEGPPKVTLNETVTLRAEYAREALSGRFRVRMAAPTGQGGTHYSFDCPRERVKWGRARRKDKSEVQPEGRQKCIYHA